MKKWVQKTAGLVMSVFLALGLGAKVHAADEEEALPAPAPVEVAQPAPAAASDPAPAPAAEAPKPAAPAPAAEVSQPAETKPAESKPAEAKPAEAKPSETKPAESKPAESKPAETKPAESKPAETKPAESKPAESKPAESKPAESKPAESKPVESKPAEPASPAPAVEAVKPAESKPAETAPAESKPVESKPAESVPPEAKPAETKPTESSPVGQSQPGEHAPADETSKPEAAPPAAEAPKPEASAPAEETKPTEASPPSKQDEPIVAAPVEAEIPAEEMTADSVPVEAVKDPEPVSADEEKPAEAAPVEKDPGITDPASVVSSSPGEPSSGESAASPAQDPAADVEAAPAEKRSGPSAPVETTVLVETEAVTVSHTAAAAGQSASSVTIGGKDVSAEDGWTYDKDSGQVGLVDFDRAGADIVSSGLKGLNIAAAGFNRLRSIVSEGSVHVTGTGFLLLDSVTLGTNSGFYLHTPTDIYEDGTGSVAVFLKQTDGSYLMVNRGVTGILDEEYTLEDVGLVVPGGSSLLINSGGTMYKKDTGELILRFSGDDANCIEYSATDPAFANVGVKETVGSLTIGSGASLTVEKNAEIRMEPTRSVQKHLHVNHPVLSAVDNAGLTVKGKITGSGTVKLGAGTSLCGNGSVEANSINIGNTDVISDCGVTLSSKEIFIKSSGGTVPKLLLDDAWVVFDNDGPGVTNTIGCVTNSGESSISGPGVLTVGPIVNSGTLELHSVVGSYFPTEWNYYNLTDSVSGGTLHLDSGLFYLKDGFTLKNGAVLSGNDVIAYDEAGSIDPGSASLTVPLIVSSETAAKPELSSDGQYYSVPLVVFHSSNFAGYTGSVDTEIYSVEAPSTVYFRKQTTGEYAGKYVLTFSDDSCFKDENPVKANQEEDFVLEYQSIDEDGNLSFYTYEKINSEIELSDLPPFVFDNTWLVRIRIVDHFGHVLPVSNAASTNTSFTSTGILGGSGSLNGGDMSLIFSGPSASEPEPAPTARRIAPTLTASAPRTDWRVIVSESGRYYKVNIYYGTREVVDPGQMMTARMKFVLPEGWNKNAIFAVFRNSNGSLTAFKATYDTASGTLRFDTDLTGTFALVSFPFDGKLYSGDFYDALAELDEIRDLPVRR